MVFPFGAIVALAGQAASGIMSARNNKGMQQTADAEAARQQAYYEAKANENPLSRSENARLLAQYDRKAQQQTDAARGVAAITGTTPEYTLGVQKAVAEGRADLMGGMAAEASERKDKYEDKAETARHKKVLDDQERRAARNTTYANLAANAASAAGSIMDSYTAGRQKSPTNTPNGGNTHKIQTGTAIKTDGVDMGNLHVAQDGTVSNKFNTARSNVLKTPQLNLPDVNGGVYIPNGDGTYTGKNGMTYMRNPDGTYKLYFS